MRIPVRYEWDPWKRRLNLAKHDLDFEDAWQVFESRWKDDVESPRWSAEERRAATAYAATARSVCVLVYVIRGDAVRCISFRRASRIEREEYREYLEAHRQLYE